MKAVFVLAITGHILYQTKTMEPVETEKQKFISFENAMLRVRDQFILPNINWHIYTRQNWAVLGPNGAGKSSIAGALAGNVPVVRGKMTRHLPQALSTQTSYVSFDLEQHIIARDESRDDARFFSGKTNTLEKANTVILQDYSHEAYSDVNYERIVDALQIQHLLGREIRYLSTGEIRKILIARALVKSPGLLILDEPFAGLDVPSITQLKSIISKITGGNSQLVLVTHRLEEITANITHILCLKDNGIFLKGSKEKVLASEKINRLYSRKRSAGIPFPLKESIEKEMAEKEATVLVEMKQVTVKYGDLTVLDNLDWTLKTGENWTILGPNGSGKSTFLNLITGDNQQAYANEIFLFGKRKGSGESVWDIKKKIGVASSQLQRHYRKKIRACDVILSGFFDSVGLYRGATLEQRAIAAKWMETIGMADSAQRLFDQFSYGEKRMILIARAMVKMPLLLILDEPCQGLDKENRHMMMALVEYVGRQTDTCLLYVTHHRDEIPRCTTDILRLT